MVPAGLEVISEARTTKALNPPGGLMAIVELQGEKASCNESR